MELAARAPVQARCADNDDLIGGSEDSPSRRFENSGPRVEADQVVVAFEKLNGPLELVLADRLGNSRIVIRRDIQPLGLRRVSADICDRSSDRRRQGAKSGWRSFFSDAMSERPRSDFRLPQRAVASVGRERVTDQQARAGLSDAALPGDERDLAAACDGSLDPCDEFALADLLGARPHRDVAAREREDRSPPPARGTKCAGLSIRSVGTRRQKGGSVE